MVENVSADNSSPRRTRSELELSEKDLRNFLTAYRPEGIDSGLWRTVAAPAVDLVLTAGRPTRTRVRNDIQILADVIAHLNERGRSLTVTEALSDGALLSYDTALDGDQTTRASRRSVLRRLQAAHRELPWRAKRRADGVRVEKLWSHTEAATMRQILAAAEMTASDDVTATAFIASVATARELRKALATTTDVDSATWTRACLWATQHGWHLTRPLLRAAVTHEVLESSAPIATLVPAFALTRRDLDLALSRANDLPLVPCAADQSLLRGQS